MTSENNTLISTIYSDDNTKYVLIYISSMSGLFWSHFVNGKNPIDCKIVVYQKHWLINDIEDEAEDWCQNYE